MKNRHPDYVLESNHLSEVCRMLKAEISIKDYEINNYKGEIISIRKSMWENAKHGFGGNETEAMVEATQYISAMKSEENSYRFTKALLDKYKSLLYSPYFARVDFRENGDEVLEIIYIGLYSFINTDTMEVVVHDWRAPISSIFYEYEQGSADYITNEGIVRGEISAKRQFKIEDSKLLYMFDSSVKIDDEILQGILSGNASKKMKTIVTTIQKEQNRAIRFDAGSMLVVQGAAGSGKTSIALHRIAYLLYKDRNLNSNNIIIFSPNHIFNDYISNVLPELGEKSVIQTTFDEYTAKLSAGGFRMESFNDHMEYLLSGKTSYPDDIRIKGYIFKNSEEFLGAVRSYVAEKADGVEQLCNVYYEGKVAIKGSELRKVYKGSSANTPVNKRLAAVRIRAFFLLTKTQEIKKAEILKRVRNNSDSDREAEAAARMELQREFREVKEKVFIMTRIDLFDMYRSFFESAYFFEAGKSFGLTKNETKDISRYGIDNINNRLINYEDSVILTYLKCVIDEIPDTTDIKHVVIDEAQDYSPLQYEIFKRLFPQGSFTILGDANQLVNPYKRSACLESMTEVFGRDDKTVLRLSKSYRSTREITEFTKAMLPTDIQIEGLNRPGKLPELISLGSGSDIKRLLAEDIKRLLSDGMKSVAILCKTSEECRFLYKLLSGEVELGMVIKEDDLYKKGVNLLPSYFCKGLEFDAVLVYGADEKNYYTEGDRKLLYTLCTRALHILKIYYEGDPSPIISQVDGRLYIKLEE